MELVHFIKTDNVRDNAENLFLSEKEIISKVLPGIIVEHVGSTAVPGALTKGDVDINVRTERANFQRAVNTLKQLYAINQPDNWTDTFASFKDEDKNLGVQVTIVGSADDLFVAQRDFLVSHPDIVVEYNTLKEKFEGKDMNEYRKSKRDFFEALEKHRKNH